VRQADMILRSARATVGEPEDLEDIEERYHRTVRRAGVSGSSS